MEPMCQCGWKHCLVLVAPWVRFFSVDAASSCGDEGDVMRCVIGCLECVALSSYTWFLYVGQMEEERHPDRASIPGFPVQWGSQWDPHPFSHSATWLWPKATCRRLLWSNKSQASKSHSLVLRCVRKLRRCVCAATRVGQNGNSSLDEKRRLTSSLPVGRRRLGSQSPNKRTRAQRHFARLAHIGKR